MHRASRCPARWAALAFALTLAHPLRAADGPQEKKDQPRAPANYVVVDEDRAGAYFVARPLKEKYDALLKRLAALKEDIAAARIDSARARGEIDVIGVDLAALRGEIDRAKVYIPGAPVRTIITSEVVPIDADGLLLVDASDVEIRPRDQPGIECVVEKTVLSDEPEQVAADFAGIELVHRRTSAREFFGFYEGLEAKKGFEGEWQRFPFKEFLGRDVTYITLKGLTGQEGNRSITLKMLNEEGAGTHMSQWRRHARLKLFVPRCGRVGVRGALGGLKVQGLEAPLAVSGEGDRDYTARYQVEGLGGPLVADDIPIHVLRGIRGDVSVTATAYAENVGTEHGPAGVTMRAYVPRASDYRDIRGSLRVRFCRGDLTIEKVSGRVDVENDFGRTTWIVDGPPSQADHRVVSQSGAIEIRFAKGVPTDLAVNLFSECGAVHFPKDPGPFDSMMFTSGEGDTVRRSWKGFVAAPGGRRGGIGGLELYGRVAAALHGGPRTPGIDVLSRAGTITVVPGP